jgi:RNA polymerase sigma-70 factor (ECF subfamily)
MDELTRLFLDARSGDRAALTQAIRESEADVWRLAVHLVGRDEADDVVQDTFVRAWRALPAFRAESGARTWLLSIARRACADSVRRSVRRRRLGERLRAVPDRSVDDGTSGVRELDDLVAALDDDQRTAFVLTQMLGYSYAETAEICDVKIGTIRSRIARAREALVESVRAAETG